MLRVTWRITLSSEACIANVSTPPNYNVLLQVGIKGESLEEDHLLRMTWRTWPTLIHGSCLLC